MGKRVGRAMGDEISLVGMSRDCAMGCEGKWGHVSSCHATNAVLDVVMAVRL